MLSALNNLQQEISSLQNPAQTKVMSSFFKSSYSEGDIIWGLRAAQIHYLAKKYYLSLDLEALLSLLSSPVHEQRAVSLQCLVEKFKHSSQSEQAILVDFYLSHSTMVNNWDLVDTTAPYILGCWCYNHNTDSLLTELAHHNNLWQQRISVVAGLYYIKHGSINLSLHLAEYFLHHPHDLIQKAVGWILREIGKQNATALTSFLDVHATQMPRTMLRYAIERLSPSQRQYYLHK